MNENFLPLRRELRNHWVYTDSQYLHLWLEMLYSARFSYNPKTEVFKGVIYTVNRGEFIFSRPSYSQRLNIPQGRVRKAVELLINDNMIEVVSSLGKNKPTIYKIINYDLYNNSPSETVGGVGVQELSTKSQPSRNQVATKSQPLKKKEKKVNTEKNKDNIHLQIENLRKRYSVEQLKVIDDFLDTIRHTRSSGKIKETVIVGMYQDWDKHPDICVQYGLNTYNKSPALHSKKENYVLGIIRNSTADEAYQKLNNETKPNNPKVQFDLSD